MATTLTRHQRAHLVRRLEEERGLLSRALNRTVAEGAQADEQDRDGDLSAVPFHPADRSPDRFGICEDTGEPIPFERLDVIPWARTCGQAGASHLE